MQEEVEEKEKNQGEEDEEEEGKQEEEKEERGGEKRSRKDFINQKGTAKYIACLLFHEILTVVKYIQRFAKMFKT